MNTSKHPARLLALLILLTMGTAFGAESATWRQFVAAKRTGAEPILPDFSFAGYHGGADAIPDVAGPIFDVTKFGARGDGKADDQSAIQRTIDAAEAAGGGVVFFPPGTYRVNADPNHRRPIRVGSSRIVLRGSGATKNGTILFIDEPTLPKPGTGASAGEEAPPDWMIRIEPKTGRSAPRLATVTGDTPREAFTITVDDASKIKPGMWVSLNVRGTTVAADAIAPYKLSDLPREWTRLHTGGLYHKENHLVRSVQGDRVTLREPVKTTVKAAHGWYVSAFPNIAEVGVEDICFLGAWLGKFVHHRSVMDDNGWSALMLFNVVDSWVRRCAFINLNQHLGFDSCAYTSVLQNVLAGTMGHVSVGTPRRCTGMLFGLMRDQMEQQTKDTTHGIGAAGSAVGNVYWRYTMQPDQSFDMHGNFPYATLFDGVVGGNLANSGGPVVSFPNHLRHFVAWNFRHTKMPARIAQKARYDWWGGRPSLVKPIIVGMHGVSVGVRENEVGIHESPGKAVAPESLYEAQLALRFGGTLPAWVEKAKRDWAAMQRNLPEFPRGGDNTPFVARKRRETIQWILDTPMRKELYDKSDPRGALLRQWPAAAGGQNNDAVPSKLVVPGPDGRLVYRPYTPEGDTLPDFSHCGYAGGGDEIPDVAAKITLGPAGGSGDDRARIQAALDQVAKLPRDRRGFRGAVLLKRGRYGVGGPLAIAASGVVLRGEGDNENGTVLIATGRRAYALIEVRGRSGATPVPGASRRIIDRYVPVGARTFAAAGGHGLKVGDTVFVRRVGNAAWIRAIGMDRIAERPGHPGSTKQWTPFFLDFDRVITAVDGNRITVDAPIVCAIDARWGGGEVVPYGDPGRIEQVGVENLRAVSEFDRSKTAVHRGETYFSDENHAEYLVRFDNVRNAWARRVSTLYLAHGVAFFGRGAKWVTVEDASALDPVSVITGGRRYAFQMTGQLLLVRRCFARNSRHAFVLGSRVPGPNVFLDCRSERDHATSEPHHRWSVGGLYDNVHAPIAFQDRQWMGSGHGWAGANYVAWNCRGSLVCQQPPTAQNFAIGFVGTKAKGAFPRPEGWWESPGRHVAPRSLYQKQREDRL